MFQMVSLGTILEHFGPKAVQMLHIVSLDANAAQMLQTISFGILLYPFGPKTTQMLQHMLLMISFASMLDHLLSDSCL